MRFYIRKTDADSVKIYYDIGISKTVKLRGVTDQEMNPAWNDFRLDKDGKILMKDRKRVRQTTVDLDKINVNAPDGQKQKAKDVRNALEEFETEMTTKLTELKKKYDDDKSIRDEMQDEINEHYGKADNESRKMAFIQYIDHFIKTQKNKKITRNRQKVNISEKRLYDFDLVKRRICEFRDDTQASLKYSKINNKWHSDFQDYLENEKDYEYGTIGKYSAILKTFLRHAYIDGQHTSLKYMKFEVLKVSKDKDYLNESQLADFESRSYDARDKMSQSYFLLMSFTGMRVSEILSLSSESLITHKGVDMIKFFESKNNVKRYFIISEDVRRILALWNNGFPNDNKHFKDQVKYHNILAFCRREFTDKKIRPHSGRRNFCTNEYIKGTDVEDIMLQSGHKTRSVFMNYVQDTGDDVLAERQINRMKNKEKS